LEAQREVVEGLGAIRLVMIPPTAFFGPIAIFACLTTDNVVELVSVIEDTDYWDARPAGQTNDLSDGREEVRTETGGRQQASVAL
jgi:hypothetical protein